MLFQHIFLRSAQTTAQTGKGCYKHNGLRKISVLLDCIYMLLPNPSLPKDCGHFYINIATPFYSMLYSNLLRQLLQPVRALELKHWWPEPSQLANDANNITN